MESHAAHNTSDFLVMLPSELILFIFQFLSPQELLRLSAVCSITKHIAEDASLWKENIKTAIPQYTGNVFTKQSFFKLKNHFYKTHFALAAEIGERLLAPSIRVSRYQSEKFTQNQTLYKYADLMKDIIQKYNDQRIETNRKLLVSYILNWMRTNRVRNFNINLPQRPYQQTLSHYFAAVGDTVGLDALIEIKGDITVEDVAKASAFTLLVKYYLQKLDPPVQDHSCQTFKDFFVKVFLKHNIKIPVDQLIYCFEDSRIQTIIGLYSDKKEFLYLLVALGSLNCSFNSEDLDKIKKSWSDNKLGKFDEHQISVVMSEYKNSVSQDQALTVSRSNP